MPTDPVNIDLQRYDKQLTKNEIVSDYINETEAKIEEVKAILCDWSLPIAETLDKLEVLFTELQDQISYTRDLLKLRR